MADVSEVARRREIRRRKILENSDARWIKITGSSHMRVKDASSTVIPQEAHLKVVCSQENHQDSVEDITSGVSYQCRVSNSSSGKRRTVSTESENASSLHSRPRKETEARDSSYMQSSSLRESRPSFPTDSSDSMAINGTMRRRSGPSSAYAFPKKVSDAENRSYGRTKGDACRRGSCTQLMMETLQLSSLSFASLRPWIVLVVALIVRLWFSINSRFMFSLQNVWVPFGIMEIALYVYTKFFHQGTTRSSQSMLGAALILCGLPATFVTRLTNHLVTLSDLGRDCSIYLFSFIIFHTLYEDWLV